MTYSDRFTYLLWLRFQVGVKSLVPLVQRFQRSLFLLVTVWFLPRDLKSCLYDLRVSCHPLVVKNSLLI